MSFLKSLFGFGQSPPAESSGEKLGEPVEYKGFVIRAAPFESAGQYQTAGIIEKEIDGVRKQHRFIRADRLASFDDAVEFTHQKARQIVDQLGERMFDQAS
jgi:hypothetical protein